jgi:hypothetical protein
MSGEARLVPPTWTQPPLLLSYTAAPVLGSASAETSATVRLEQPESCCHEGFASKAEQPEPAPDQADSETHVEPLTFSVVPPTAVTFGDAAGYSTP